MGRVRGMSRRQPQEIDCWVEPTIEMVDDTDEELDEEALFFQEFSELMPDAQVEVLKEKYREGFRDPDGILEALLEHLGNYYEQLEAFAPAWVIEGILPIYDVLGKFILYLYNPTR